jgi:L-ascorbate metabolism protein UlaG (beta-lactamase superfamily)
VAEREGEEAREGLAPRRALSRRALIAGVASVGAGAAACELLSLDGRFDHRRALAPSGADRYQASLQAAGNRAGVIHIGHSTHVVCMQGLRILTDPWFYDPAFGSVAHAPAPAVTPDALGKLDAIVVSHDHPDHADLRALDQLPDKKLAVLVATEALASRVRQRGFSELHVLAPWQTFRLGTVEVHAVPALHDVYEIGFVIRSASESIYFAGDTRLMDELPEIRERHHPALAILPVDGTRVRTGALWVMTPEDAVFAAGLLGVSAVLPSHAEARITDPLVERVLTRSIPGAARKCAELARVNLPGVRCSVPSAGEWVPLES